MGLLNAVLESAVNWSYAVRNAMNRNPRYCKAYLRAGAAAMALQRPSEALSMYQQALQLKPKSSKAKVCMFISTACFLLPHQGICSTQTLDWH